ncbi:MAG TPA: TlpA disulfide reductase family protein [Vicinamibacterales bacterium]|nr:TlpA disulfide reductase family protein [Vicinamibacterales bacterium]
MRAAHTRQLIVMTAVLYFGFAPLATAQAPYFETRDLQGAVDALNVVDLQDKRWTAADLKGRVVLIDFWATWCAPCLAQIPEFKRLRATYGEQFEVLAISLDSRSRRDLVAWLNRQDVAWPQVHDGRAFSSPAARPFGVAALPASLLVVDGRIAAKNLRGEGLSRAIAEAFGPR